MLQVAPATKRVIAGYAIIVAILAGLLWLSIRQTGSAVERTNGVVEAVTFGPGEREGPAGQTAIVRRPDGTLIQAQVPNAASVRSGDAVKVVGYQRFFSTARTYEIVESEAAR